MNVLEDLERISIGGLNVNNIRYADDTDKIQIRCYSR